jgi:hypothetical protein
VPSPRRGKARHQRQITLSDVARRATSRCSDRPFRFIARNGAAGSIGRFVGLAGVLRTTPRPSPRMAQARSARRRCRGVGPNRTGRKLSQPVARPKQTGKWAMASFPRCRRACSSSFRASSLISRAAMLFACTPKIRSHCWRARIGVRSGRAYFLSFNITSSALACGLSRHSFTKASVCFSSVSTLNLESPDFPSRKPWRKAIATSRF